MDVNWIIIALVFIVILLVIVLLIVKNQRDKNELESFLNADLDSKAKSKVDLD